MLTFSQRKDKLTVHGAIGSYPARLLVPSFNPIHPGVNIGLDYDWKLAKRWALVPSIDIGYLYHENIQRAFQLYSEMEWQLRYESGLVLKPLAIGGGYVRSISDMTDVLFDPSTGTWSEINSARNNFQITLGMGVAYQTGLLILDRPLSLGVDYRIWLQGKVVDETVPLIAYAPLKLEFSLPLSKEIND